MIKKKTAVVKPTTVNNIVIEHLSTTTNIDNSNNITNISNTTSTNNNSTKNINMTNNLNLTKKLPESMFQALIDKVGRKNAVQLLIESCNDNDTIKIYKKLFPSQKLSDNPIIYHNNHFKYLDNNNKIVINDEIIQKVARDIQTAMLYASSEFITESIITKQTDRLYEVYDIGDIQGNISDLCIITDQLTDYIKDHLS